MATLCSSSKSTESRLQVVFNQSSVNFTDLRHLQVYTPTRAKCRESVRSFSFMLFSGVSRQNFNVFVLSVLEPALLFASVPYSDSFSNSFSFLPVIILCTFPHPFDVHDIDC